MMNPRRAPRNTGQLIGFDTTSHPSQPENLIFLSEEYLTVTVWRSADRK